MTSTGPSVGSETIGNEGSLPNTREVVANEELGRYIAIDEIGRGAMGVVSRAYDPRLQREVALKELIRAALTEEAAGQLLREARVMAQLSHPNVAAIYDVYETKGRLFLAMEYVAGTTLSRWLATARRPTSEILSMFLDAGRGLAAAHAKSLLHRDFKPNNVLVGQDGRVVVTDFGLALAQRELPSAVFVSSTQQGMEVEVRDDLTQDLTASDQVVGTPRYMAPEQHAGAELTPTVDQYAFCVSLWEALCGRAPFCPPGLAAKKDAGPPTWPERIACPAHVVRALRRGLQADPAKRWPSMQALLEALALDGARSRLRKPLLWIGGGVAVTLGLIGLLTPGAREPCRGARDQLTGIWNEARRERVQQAVVHAAPYGDGVWTGIGPILDDYVETWIAGHRDACEAANVRRDQSEAELDLRMTCLQRARQDLEAAVEVLEDADEAALRRAHVLVGGLPSLEYCEDLDALRDGHVPAPPAEHKDVEAIRQAIARAKAQTTAGRYPRAKEVLEQSLPLLERITHVPTIASTRASMGSTLHRLGEIDAAEAELRVARGLALGARDRHRARWALQQSVLLNVRGRVRIDIAEALLRQARALTRPDDPPQSLGSVANVAGQFYAAKGRADLAEVEFRRAVDLFTRAGELDDAAGMRNNRANALRDLGQLDEAERQYRLSLDHMEKRLGPEHPGVGTIYAGLGAVIQAKGDPIGAERACRRAYDNWRKAVGPDNPTVGMLQINLGQSLNALGRFAEGEEMLRSAITVLEKTLGPRHAAVAMAKQNLSVGASTAGRHEEAVALLREALEIDLLALGPDHPDVALMRANLGQNLHQLERHAEAETELLEAMRIRIRAYGPDHHEVCDARERRALVLQALGREDEAESELTRAWEDRRRLQGDAHKDTCQTLMILANLHREQGQPHRAREELKRAETCGEEARVLPAHRERIQRALAKTHWDIGHRQRAIELATAARKRLHGDEPDVVSTREAIDDWLLTTQRRTSDD